MKKYAIVSLLAVIGHCLTAQHKVILKDGQEDFTLNSFVYQYIDRNVSCSSINTVLLADSTAFVRNTAHAEVNYSFDQPKGWCKFYILNTASQENWILKVQQSRADTVLLYIVREHKAPEILPMTGHFQNIAQRPVYSLPIVYPIGIKKGENIVLYLYTQREYGRHAAILNFQQKDHFENDEHFFNVLLGFVSGIVLLATLVGFILFLFVKQKVYVYYSIYALSFFLVLMVDSGFANSVLSIPFYQTVINGFSIVFYYWFCGWHILFTIELLKVKKNTYPLFYWFGLFMGYYFCLAAFLLLIPALPEYARWWLVTISYYAAFPGTAYILYIISVSILKNEPIVYFYMAGFYFTVAVGFMLTLSDLEVFSYPDMNKDLYYLTPLVEVLCVVVGIGIHFSKTVRGRFKVQQALTQTRDQIITIQEDERRRIAQDLHDDVGNSLAAIKNMVILKTEPVSIEKEINNLIGSVRTISQDLMPVNFNEFSLVEAVSHTVNKFKDHPTIALEFHHSGKPVKIRALTELVIFRIINELITNIIKHSQATQAFIQLIYQKDSLVVTVDDNGVGVKKNKTEEGPGIRSIQSRAAYINATLKMESDDKGTLIILEVPYENT